MKKKFLFSVFAIACICMVNLQMGKVSASNTSSDTSLNKNESISSGEAHYWNVSEKDCSSTSGIYCYVL